MTMFQNLRRMMSGSDTLKIKCGACGHTRTWSRAEAFKIYTADAAPFDIKRSARCSRCAAKRDCEIWI